MIDAITGQSLDNQVQGISAGTLDKDAFLQLLVAQIRYQNPLEPLDSQEYLAQTAQFAMVERIEEMAKSQAASMSFQRAQLSSSLVGQQVTGIDPIQNRVISGVVQSVAFNEGNPVLLIGGFQIGLENITSVAKPAENQAPDPDGTEEVVEPQEAELVDGEPIEDAVAVEDAPILEEKAEIVEDDAVLPLENNGVAPIEIDEENVVESGIAIQVSDPIVDAEQPGDQTVVDPDLADDPAVPVPTTNLVESGIDTAVSVESPPGLAPNPDRDEVDESAIPLVESGGTSNPAPDEQPEVADSDVTEEQAIRFAALTSRITNQPTDRSAALRDGYRAGSSRNE